MEKIDPIEEFVSMFEEPSRGSIATESIPSSFNWWGAWLSPNLDKIILRPSNNFFSLFKVNNKDLWPSDWIEIS